MENNFVSNSIHQVLSLLVCVDRKSSLNITSMNIVLENSQDHYCLESQDEGWSGLRFQVDFLSEPWLFYCRTIFGVTGISPMVFWSSQVILGHLPYFANFKGGKVLTTSWGSLTSSCFPHPLSHLFLCQPLFNQHDSFSSVTKVIQFRSAHPPH